MTQLEDQLRTAFRAKASEITPPPPPLQLRPRLVADPAVRGRGSLAAPPQRKWVVPLTAAAAVLAVVAGALVITRVLTAQHRPPTAPVQIGVPRYYVALDSQRPPSSYPEPLADATVRVTATSAVIARITPPSPYNNFVAVSGATDDRTFVLLAKAPPDPFTGVTPERFYLLRIDPTAPSAAQRAALTALPAGDIPAANAEIPLGDEVGSMALSPDGSTLAAILTLPAPGKQRRGAVFRQDNYLYLYDLATGTTRIWVRKLCAGCQLATIGNQDGAATEHPGLVTLTWSADGGSLAFISGPGATQLRLLDLSAPGDNAQPASTAFEIHAPVSTWNQAVMTPDAKTIFLDFNGSRGRAVWASLMRYSVTTGHLTRINTLPEIEQNGHSTGYSNNGALNADTILWASYDGSKVIVADAERGNSVGVYSGRKYTPLPWPADAIDAAW
jgi:hypothetical protein